MEDNAKATKLDDKMNIDLKSSVIDTKNDALPKRKISVRQLMILFFFATISGITRVSVSLTDGQDSSKAIWLAPIIALLPALLLIFILHEITKKHREKSLAQIIEMSLGKILGKTVLFAFFLYIILYISFYVRNFAEKFISSIFPGISPSFFMIALLLFSLFAARKNIESFARFAEITFILTVAVFVIAFFMSMFHVNPKNLYPVTSHDMMPLLKASLPSASLFSLLTFSLFLGDNTSRKKSNPDDFKRTSAKFMLYLALFNLVGSAAVVGIFNSATISHMSMPYFMMFKTIKTTGLIQSLETFFILFWVFTDLIMTAYYLFVLSKVSGRLFVLGKPELFLVPIAFIILILSYFIGENEFEVEHFYSNIVSYGSIILGFGIPVIVLAAGKARRIL